MKKWSFLIGLIMFLGSPTMGLAHSWYETACCNERDCYELGYTPKAVKGGYVLQDGSFFPSKLLRESRDTKWHACKAGRTIPICLYAPLGY